MLKYCNCNLKLFTREANKMNLLLSSAWDTFVRIFNGPIVGEDIGWDDQLIILLRVLIAGLLGLVIGYERHRRQKEAGLATHFIVASASALFTCISTSLKQTAGVDGERIAAQVVSGVGFLGAGMIFFRRESLRGLTTAAGIWATAAIGMSVAVGQIIVAIIIVAIFLVLQTILHSKRVKRGNWHMLMVKFVYTEENQKTLMEYFDFIAFHRVKLTKDGERLIAETVIYPKKNFYAHELSAFMLDNPDVFSIERLEDL